MIGYYIVNKDAGAFFLYVIRIQLDFLAMECKRNSVIALYLAGKSQLSETKLLLGPQRFGK